MAQQYIDTGSSNIVGGEGLRSAFDKVNDNFSELDSLYDVDTSYMHYQGKGRLSSGLSGDNWRILYPYNGTVAGSSLSWGPPEHKIFANTTGSVIFLAINVTSSNFNNAEYKIGIKINPTDSDSVVNTTSWDFTQSFNNSSSISHSFSPSVDFNPGDRIGVAIYRNGGTQSNNLRYTVLTKYTP